MGRMVATTIARGVVFIVGVNVRERTEHLDVCDRYVKWTNICLDALDSIRLASRNKPNASQKWYPNIR